MDYSDNNNGHPIDYAKLAREVLFNNNMREFADGGRIAKLIGGSLSPSSDNGFRDSSSVGSYSAAGPSGNNGWSGRETSEPAPAPNVNVRSSSSSYDSSWLPDGEPKTAEELRGNPVSYHPLTYPQLNNVPTIDYGMWSNAMGKFMSQNTPDNSGVGVPSAVPEYPSVWQALGSGMQMSPSQGMAYETAMQPYVGYHYGQNNLPTTNVFNLPGIEYSPTTQAMAAGGHAKGNDAVSNALRLIK